MSGATSQGALELSPSVSLDLSDMPFARSAILADPSAKSAPIMAVNVVAMSGQRSSSSVRQSSMVAVVLIPIDIAQIQSP